MTLSKKQKTQIELQLSNHQHDKYKVDINLNENETLKDFIVYDNVMRPELMASKLLAVYLYNNRKQYDNDAIVWYKCFEEIENG